MERLCFRWLSLRTMVRMWLEPPIILELTGIPRLEENLTIFCCFWQPDSLTVLSAYTLQTCIFVLVIRCYKLYPLIILQNCCWLYPQASNCLVANLKVASLGPFDTWITWMDLNEYWTGWRCVYVFFHQKTHIEGFLWKIWKPEDPPVPYWC